VLSTWCDRGVKTYGSFFLVKVKFLVGGGECNGNYHVKQR